MRCQRPTSVGRARARPVAVSIDSASIVYGSAPSQIANAVAEMRWAARCLTHRIALVACGGFLNSRGFFKFDRLSKFEGF